MAPFKRYEQLSELVKMYPCLYNKQEKDFKKEEVKQRAWKEIAKELDLESSERRLLAISLFSRKNFFFW